MGKYSKIHGDALGWSLVVLGQIDGENIYDLLDHRGKAVDATSWSGKRWIMLGPDENPWKAIPQHYSDLNTAMSLLPTHTPVTITWIPEREQWGVMIGGAFQVWREELTSAILDAFLDWKGVLDKL